MERNANDNFGNQNSSDASSGAGFGGTSGQGSQAGSQGTASGTGGYGGSTAGTSGAGGFGGTSDANFSRDAGSHSGGIADRANAAMGTAKDKLADAGSTVRDKAGNLKSSLADALESGAEKLRQQGAGGGQLAGAAATGGSSGMISSDANRLADVSNQVAGGLQASADWLRDADLDGLRTGLERQVKEHPGRTLAVAVGLGYLLGKAIRK
ncbi:MAG TPA: hypothetical protein VGP25_08025 [Gemmatimonadaceae bacterium]|jgi:ElaB/YqjD/DUF883 family membrane-anchored ribosome-binding protein|nr:hypothetical protein [Gemmatimonadaceae bacterium]